MIIRWNYILVELYFIVFLSEKFEGKIVLEVVEANQTYLYEANNIMDVFRQNIIHLNRVLIDEPNGLNLTNTSWTFNKSVTFEGINSMQKFFIDGASFINIEAENVTLINILVESTDETQQRIFPLFSLRESSTLHITNFSFKIRDGDCLFNIAQKVDLIIYNCTINYISPLLSVKESTNLFLIDSYIIPPSLWIEKVMINSMPPIRIFKPFSQNRSGVLNCTIIDFKIEESEIICISAGIAFIYLRIEFLIILRSKIKQLIEIDNIAYPNNIAVFKKTVISECNLSINPAFSFKNFDSIGFDYLLATNSTFDFQTSLLSFENINRVSLVNISIFRNKQGTLIQASSLKRFQMFNFKIINNNIQEKTLIFLNTISLIEVETIQLIKNMFYNSTSLSIISKIIYHNNHQTKVSFTDCMYGNNTFLLINETILLQIEGIISFKFSLFGENLFLSKGKFLRCDNEKIILLVSECTFNFNRAQSFFHMLHFFGDSLILTNSKFDNNYLKSEIKVAMIMFSGNLLFIKGCIFSENFASSSSVFELNENNQDFFSHIVVLSSKIYRNSGNSSAIRIMQSGGFLLYFNQNDVFENKFEKFGFFFLSMEILFFDKYIAIFQECNFNFNHASNGVIFYISTSKMKFTFSKCLFYGNMAVKIGGVFFFNTEKNNFFYLLDTIFLKNFAYKSAVLHIFLGIVYIKNCTFSNNIAFFSSTTSVETYSNISFFNCIIKEAKSIYSHNILAKDSSTTVLINTVFYGCSALQINAGITVNWMAKVTIFYCRFQNISADKGAILFGSSAMYKIYFENCFITISESSISAVFDLKHTHIKIISSIFLDLTGAIFFASYSEINVSNLSLFLSTKINFHTPTGIIAINMVSKCIVMGILIIDFSNSNRPFYFNIGKNSELSISSGVVYSIHKNIFIYADSGFVILNNTIGCIKSCFFNGLDNVNVIFNTIYLYAQPIDAQKITGIHLTNGTLQIIQSLFSNFTDSTIKIINSRDSTNLLKNTKIINSFAYQGAGVYVFDSDIFLFGIEFENNNATFVGGGLFLDCQGYEICKWVIEKCNFKNNNAKAGKGIHWTTHPPKIDKELEDFLKLPSTEDNFIASFPLFFETNIDDIRKFGYFTSGDVIDIPIIIKLKDYYNQTATYLNELIASISFSEPDSDLKIEGRRKKSSSIVGNTNSYISNGSANFLGLKFVSTPKFSKVIIIKSQAINYAHEFLLEKNELINKSLWNHQILQNKYQYRFIINFTSCSCGEIYKEEMNICFKCPLGTFSLTANDNSCSLCPSGADCPGGAEIVLHRGFWRKSFESSNIIKCRNELACIGGSKAGDNLCLKGHHGPLCGVCISNETLTFFRDFDLLCKPCDSEENVRMNIIMISMIVFLLLYLILMIFSKITSHHTIKTAVLKIFTDYLHFSTLLITIVSRKHSGIKVIRTIINLFDPFNLFILLDCNTNKMMTELSLFFKKQILLCIIIYSSPVFIIISCLFVLIFRKEITIPFRVLFLQSFFIFFYVFQPLMIKMLFSAFICLEIDGRSYLSRQLNEECWSDQHKLIVFILIIPLLILIMAVIPIFFARQLRERFKGGFSMEVFGYMSNSFRRHLYFWEFILLLQKYIIILSTAFVEDLNIFFIFLILVLFFFLFLNSLFKPYTKISINQLFISSRIATLNLLIFIFMIFNDIPDLFYVLTMITLIITNIWFLFLSLRIYFMKKILNSKLNKLFFFQPKKLIYVDNQKETIAIDENLGEISTVRSKKSKVKLEFPNRKQRSIVE